MKKGLAVLLALCMTLSLAACGGSKSSSTTKAMMRISLNPSPNIIG